jgi:predicted DNA-binding protein
MKARIHIVLPTEEKERYRAIAEREGTTLSRWIRGAVRERAATYHLEHKLDTVEELEAFFEKCDQLHDGSDLSEPEWEDHKKLIQESRTGGSEAT